MKIMFLRFTLLLALSVLGCFAGEVRPTDRVIPLIQDGGGWTTTITVVNLEKTPARFEMLLRTRFLKTWNLPVSGADVKAEDGYVRGTVPGNGTLSFRTAGTGAVESGYGLIFSLDGGRLGVSSLIQQPFTGVSLAIPLVPEREDKLTIPFDNTEGASTALVWLSETPFTLVDYRGIASDGTELVAGRYQFAAQDPASQEMFVLAERFPELKGKKGAFTMDLNYPNVGIYDDLYFSAFAIQTLPSGVMFGIPSMAADTWKASRH